MGSLGFYAVVSWERGTAAQRLSGLCVSGVGIMDVRSYLIPWWHCRDKANGGALGAVGWLCSLLCLAVADGAQRHRTPPSPPRRQETVRRHQGWTAGIYGQSSSASTTTTPSASTALPNSHAGPCQHHQRYGIRIRERRCVHTCEKTVSRYLTTEHSSALHASSRGWPSGWLARLSLVRLSRVWADVFNPLPSLGELTARAENERRTAV